MTNINLLRISAQGRHLKSGFQIKEIQSPVPKHVEYQYFSEIVFHCVNLLVVLLIIKISTV